MFDTDERKPDLGRRHEPRTSNSHLSQLSRPCRLGLRYRQRRRESLARRPRVVPVACPPIRSPMRRPDITNTTPRLVTADKRRAEQICESMELWSDKWVGGLVAHQLEGVASFDRGTALLPSLASAKQALPRCRPVSRCERCSTNLGDPEARWGERQLEYATSATNSDTAKLGSAINRGWQMSDGVRSSTRRPRDVIRR